MIDDQFEHAFYYSENSKIRRKLFSRKFFKSIIEKDGEVAVKYFFLGGAIVLLYTIRGMKGISIEISDDESTELIEIINRKVKEFRALYGC